MTTQKIKAATPKDGAWHDVEIDGKWYCTSWDGPNFAAYGPFDSLEALANASLSGECDIYEEAQA